MSGLRALYFDGRTSLSREVGIHVDEDELIVQGPEVDLRYPLSRVTVSERVADIARTLTLPNGAICEIQDNAALDRLLPASSRSQRLYRLLHLMESRLTLVLVALAVAVLAGWAAIQHGVPYLARGIAHSLPPEIDRRLGQGALQGLDHLVFEPSELDRDDQQHLRQAFAALAESAGMAERARLEFRSSPQLGANALALPSGIVVLTDELVALARGDQELLGVLAHELGHIDGRHSLRGVLQNAITPVLVATVTGDVTSISALAGTLPTILIDLKYSRLFELEADSFAVTLLTRNGIPPSRLADILGRMAGADDEALSDYLSTHPATADRIERLTRP